VETIFTMIKAVIKAVAVLENRDAAFNTGMPFSNPLEPS
jgi:hypothetical protein